MGNRKLILRMMVDLLMTVCLLGLMSFMLTGQQYHEWIGAAALILFIIHHILNLTWIRQSGRGRYTPYRVLQSLLVILVFLAILGCMVSGIVMSQYVFAFLPIQGGMSLARLVHLVCVYWSFILMSLHLGLHWNMILGVVRKAAGMPAPSPLRTAVMRLLAAVVAAYGIYAFLKHRLTGYLSFSRAHVCILRLRAAAHAIFGGISDHDGAVYPFAHYVNQFIGKQGGKS